jgi:intracellular multiplication protein IcmF
MLQILKSLFQTIRKITEQFPEDQKATSFLIASGLHHQGTTTLLKQAQMQHIQLDEEFPLQLFYNKNGIILELNETWAQQSEVSLPQLFKKLNRCHKKLRISGFLFFVDVNELMLQNHEEQAQKIKKHCQHFQKFIAALDYPVRSGLVMTKLDQITGFTDFFQMSHELELQEPLGFSLSSAKAQQRFAHIFSDAWSNFIGHLNQLMLLKVHTTRANKKRLLIREFPLQIALLESRFLNMLKNISHQRTHIHGIYFTCSEQKGMNINYLNQKIQQDFSLLVPISSVQSVNYKQFFIQGAIHNSQELSSYTPKPNPLADKSTQFLISTGLLLSSYIVFQTFKTHHAISNAQYQLEHASTWQNDRQIMALETSYNQLETLPFIFKYISQIDLLKNYIAKLEKNIYQQQYANKIISIIESECNHTQLAKSYAALKVYKAIAEKRHDQSAFISEWFINYWQEHGASTNIPENTRLLKKFLWQLNWPINHSIIHHTENLLSSISPEYLAFEVVSDTFMKDTETYQLFGFNTQNLVIPKCYLKKNFHDVENKLNVKLQELEKDHWLLGYKYDPQSQNKMSELYARKYVHWWQNLSTTIHPKHFSSFEEARDMFQAFAKKDSISNVLGLITEQTQPNMSNTNDSFNHLVANQFSNLQFAGNQTDHLKQIWRANEKFVNMFIVLNDGGKASFQYLRSYFNQTQFNDALYTLGDKAKHLPEPCKSWLMQIQDDIWVLMLQSARNHINQVWHESIFTPYQQQLAPYYPLTHSNQEMNMQVFETWFAPNGKLQQFFREYLQAFINTSQAQWIGKEIENKKFPISDELIQRFIQANIITNMFFPNNTSQCHIQFSVEKMTLDPVISQLKLTIGDQVIVDNQQENIYIPNLHWPAADAFLSIQTLEGKKFQIEEKGIWGLFRLLEQVNVLNDPNDASAIQVLLEINGNSGRYLFKSNSPINPFMPSIFKDFSLNEKIIE